LSGTRLLDVGGGEAHYAGVKPLFWALVAGLVIASFAAHNMWFMLAALGVGAFGSLNGVFD
jgi:hypothetical protein